MDGWKNTLWRAARTFVQAALSYIMTALGGGLAGLYDANGKISRVALGGLAVSALSAGIAALMNLPPKDPGIEKIEGAAVVKKAVTTIEDLPQAGEKEKEYWEAANG